MDARREPAPAAIISGYVDRLKAEGALRDPAVERAFRRVPRHLFVQRFFVGSETDGWTAIDHEPERPQPEHLEKIYSGAALITRLENNVGTSSSSQPALMADMLQLLDVRPGMRVLEIGAGTGYNAALLAELTGAPSHVTSIDIQPDVVDQARRSLARAGYPDVRVLCRDGFEGATESAPFDRIVATVGCPDLSPHWANQLAPAGFMLIPLRHAGANPLVRVSRSVDGPADGCGSSPADRPAADNVLAGAVVSFSGFMAMQGALADPHYYDFTRPPSSSTDGEVERPLWSDLVQSRQNGAQSNSSQANEARLSFWFYLGLCDPRTRLFRWATSFGLKDPATGKIARVEQDRLIGDPTLLDALDTHYQTWRTLGAPTMHHWQLRFVPADAPTGVAAQGKHVSPAPAASVDNTWTLAGPYYRRLFTLAAR